MLTWAAVDVVCAAVVKQGDGTIKGLNVHYVDVQSELERHLQRSHLTKAQTGVVPEETTPAISIGSRRGCVRSIRLFTVSTR